jgi:hypothetical protein
MKKTKTIVTLFLAIIIAVVIFAGSNIFVVKAEYPHGAISRARSQNLTNIYGGSFMP